MPNYIIFEDKNPLIIVSKKVSQTKHSLILLNCFDKQVSSQTNMFPT